MPEVTPRKKKSFFNKNWQYILIIGFCCIYLLWAIPHWVYKPEEAGQFGDLFGAITALIGTFSVILLIKSIHLQHRELALARKEYKLGLQEMVRQNEIGEQQLINNKIIQQNAQMQAIEATYFNMINLYNNYVDNLSFGTSAGKAVFVGEYNLIMNKYFKPSNTQSINLENLGAFRERYNSYRAEGELNIGRYYNLMHNVLKYIYSCGASMEKREFYLDTFINLMTIRELTLNFLYIKLKMKDGKTVVRYELDLFLKISGIYDRVSFTMLKVDNATFLRNINCDS